MHQGKSRVRSRPSAALKPKNAAGQWSPDRPFPCQAKDPFGVAVDEGKARWGILNGYST